MNIESFIAKRLREEKSSPKSITGPAFAFSVFAIILGLVLMIISVATGTGLQKEIQDKLIGFTGHIQISKFDINASYENAPITTDQSFYPKIPYSGFKHIQKYATKAGILKADEDFEGVVFKGISEDYNLDYLKKNMISGVIPKFKFDEQNDSIVLSKDISNTLRLNNGDTARMYFMREAPKPPRIRQFIIGGIYETGLEDLDKTFVIGDFNTIKKLNRWEDDEVGGFEVIIDENSKLDERADFLKLELPFELMAESVKQKNEKIFQWIDLFDLNIYIIITIMLLVSFLNMVMALLILILERTTFIGILKSIGANNRSVKKIFIRHSISIILKGLLWGNGIGIGICLLQKYTGFIKLDQATYYVSEVPIHLDPMIIIALNALTFAICFLALLIPSTMITRITPVKVLRFD